MAGARSRSSGRHRGCGAGPGGGYCGARPGALATTGLRMGPGTLLAATEHPTAYNVHYVKYDPVINPVRRRRPGLALPAGRPAVGSGDRSGPAGRILTSPGRARSPFPVADFRHVFAVLTDVALVIDQFVANELAEVRGAGAKPRHARDDVVDQMKA